MDLSAYPDYNYDSEAEEEDAEDVSSSDSSESDGGSVDSFADSFLAEEDEEITYELNTHFDKPEEWCKVPF